MILPKGYFTEERRNYETDAKMIEVIKRKWERIAEDLSRRVRESERITSEDLAVTVTA